MSFNTMRDRHWIPSTHGGASEDERTGETAAIGACLPSACSSGWKKRLAPAVAIQFNTSLDTSNFFTQNTGARWP